MFEKVDRVKLLLKKYLSEDLSVEEEIEFDTWLSASVENEKLVASFSDDILFDEMLKDYCRDAKIASQMKPPIVICDKRNAVIIIAADLMHLLRRLLSLPR